MNSATVRLNDEEIEILGHIFGNQPYGIWREQDQAAASSQGPDAQRPA